MKLHQLVSGIASGYASKLVQLLVSLLMVPFFLREDVLGLDGYGRAFTILALVSFLPLLTEGLAFSFTRSISRSLDQRDGEPRTRELFGAGLKILGSACAVGVVGMIALSPILLPLAGLDRSRDVVIALVLAGVLYWAENVFQIVRTPLLGRGAIAFVNATTAAEVLFRALAYLWIFETWPATLTTYFAIQLAFVVFRGVSQLFYLGWRWPDDLSGWWRQPWRAGRDAIGHSWPIAIQIGTQVAVHRLPIILANRMLSPEASGLAAIVVNTIRNYALQSLLTVLQPIAVPLAARLDPRRLSSERRQMLWRLESVYVIVSASIATTAVACMPDLVRIWLGPAYDVIALPSQVIVIATGIELAFNARLSLLIGQGLLGFAIPGIVLATVISLSVSAYFIIGPGSWVLGMFGVALYVPISMFLGVDTAFRRTLRVEDAGDGSRLRLFWFLIGASVVALVLAPAAPSGRLPIEFARVTANAIILLALAHLLLLPLPRAFATLQSVHRSLDRDVLGEPPQAGSTQV